MLKKLISILFLMSPLVIPQSDSTLILSEIMFFPQTGPNEFIELYNASETNSLDLNGFKLKYYTSNPDIIIDAGEGTILPPKSFAIILEGDYPIGSGIYDGLIPTEALVVKISDNSFGTSGMANTENRPLWLINAANDTLEAYFYSANNVQARSDEKKVMIKDSSQTNWANALVSNGTPGFTNSVTPVQFDLQMASLIFQPANPIQGDDVNITAKVKNLGTNAADIYTIEIYNDADFDSTADPGEIIFTQQYTNLASGDSMTASTILNSLPSGDYQIISKVLFALDEKPDNNQLIKAFVVFPPGNNYNDVVINEIMYAPSSGEPEWVELYNRTASPVNLRKWSFSDAATTVAITINDLYIPENGYIVLASDSSILNFYNVGSEIIVFNLPSLNNTGDAVVIKDSLGVLIDSLSYLASWGGNTGGRSLERISTEESSVDPLNWGTSQSIFKATPGYINSLTQKDFDVAVDNILFDPALPIQGDTVAIAAKIKNLGKNNANFSLQLYEDTNLDSIPDLLIGTLQNLFLASDDSSINDFNFLIEGLQSKRGFLVSAVYELDQDTLNNKFYKTITPGTPPQSIVVNEIMYAPSIGEPEWVELYNRTNFPINLRNWSFSDAAATVTITNIDKYIPENGYVVLASDSSILNFYNVGSEIIVFNLPSLNNTGDAVVIKDSLGVLIDSLSYLSSWGGNTGGRSLERIDTEQASTDPLNWGTSKSIFKATPGYINSITKKDFDIAVDNILFDPALPIQGDTVSIASKIKNIGKNDATFSLQLFEDTNLDSIPDILVSSLENLFLFSDDSSNFNFNFLIEGLQSKRGFLVSAVYELDQDTVNNKFYKTITPGTPPQSIVVNEIMYAPSIGEPEWVELYNRTDFPINLRNWKFSDAAATITITNIDKFIPANGFMVLTADSSILNFYSIPSEIIVFNLPSLNNTGDAVVIKDSLGVLIDSLSYLSSWGGNTGGRSLERISTEESSVDPLNWGTSQSIFKATPGYINSITKKDFNVAVDNILFDPSLPIQGDTVSISAKLKNIGKNDATFSLQLFEDTNLDSIPDILVSSLENLFLFSDDSSNFNFNFLIEGLQSKRGFFVSAVYELDQDTLNNKFYKTITPGTPPQSIVVNEIMYAPSTGEPEWIELYNRTDFPINLRNWSFSDAAATVTITNIDKYIPENGYVVLASDSSILNFYNVGSEIIVFNLPSLNNTGDAAVIKDSLGVLIDSLSYLASWGGNTGGRSLERISTEESSVDPLNWGTSQSIFKATPGYINSLTQKDFDITVDNILFDPQFPIQGDTVSISAKVKNLGENNATFSLQLFEDTNLDSLPDVLLENLQTLFLAAGDSGIINFSYSAENIQTKRGFFVNAVFGSDQDTTNNKFYKTITPGTPPQSIVVNEIMYAPSTGEPEWVELYNRTSFPINLRNWKFSDAAATVTITNIDKYIPENGYVVLVSDSSILNFYNVDSEIIVFNLPSLNNTGDAAVIKDSLGVLIDSLSYLAFWGGDTGGKSLERISTEQSSVDPLNWGTSRSIFKATPGYINSLTQKDFDIAVSEILFNPEFPIEGDTVSVGTKVKNFGKNEANFSLQLFEDTNLDSIPDLLLATLQNLFLVSEDSSIYGFNFFIENIQTQRGFLVNAVFASDQDTTNNKIYKAIQPGVPPQSVVINEVLFAPVGGEPEWIELFNRTSSVININGWGVSDVYTTPSSVTINQDVFIEPNSYLVLSRSADIYTFHRFIPSEVFTLSLPSLNNDIDGVVIIDNRGLQMDSVLYSNQWGGANGYSLERISVDASSNLPANWGTSLDIEQSTPGRINSLTPKQFDLSVAGMNFNPRFPVDGDDVYISAGISNNGSSIANNFNVEFYIDTDSNNVVDQLLSIISGLSLAAGDSSNVISNSPIQNITAKILTAVRIVYSADEDTLNNYFEKSVEPGFPAGIVLINEVMYNTETGKPEWVELVNVSAQEINIKDWSISDVLTTPTKSFITNSDVILQPDEYIVIAKDTSFNSAHPGVTARVFFSNFGTLGNTSDGIVIYDFRNGIIDSLFYFSAWGGGSGLSLERISFEAATIESTNWTTSLSPKGSTPGEPNSILNVPDYERDNIVINEILFDPETDNSEFVEFLNISGDSVNVGGWEIADENGNEYKLSQTSLIIPNNSFFLLAADSLVLFKYGLDESVLKNIVGVSSLGLVNSGELILLKDVKGNIIDSVWYSNKWHNSNFGSTKNISLERINPDLGANDPNNWSSSVTPIGATPGKQNSIYTVNLNKESNISVSPNPFSPDNDGFEDFTIINYKLTQATSQVRIKIFDNKGRLVRTLANNQASGSSGSVIFDGLDEDGQTLRIGIYIVFLEAINEGSGVVESMKTVVVVARKL